ncbi:hypothetical protein P378_11845 [Desulforamulus profundi]|uniref:Uncharacterized protein n=1 Tax=Desulforamulus profundi TaxID=1383067 RepID=A0A2C6MFK4_9FIRM|nr:hypothetical protein P378_11845 [Desulforamulus profundi]
MTGFCNIDKKFLGKVNRESIKSGEKNDTDRSNNRLPDYGKTCLFKPLQQMVFD